VSENRTGSPIAVDRWDEALAWYETLRNAGNGDLTDAVGREWQAWCADPVNRRIFDNLRHLLADRGLYRSRRPWCKAEIEEDAYDLSVPIAEWLRVQTSREAHKRRSFAGNRWWWLSAGVAIAAGLVLLLLSPLGVGSRAGPGSPAVYQTDIGGLKDVHLRDGSSIVLGGRTVLSVAFSAQRRSVELMRGQAWFRVAHNAYWPFVVAAGDGTITAVGTAFVVTRDSNRVVVAVTEGAVEVSERSSMPVHQGIDVRPTLSRIRVSRGEELAFADDGALSPLMPADTQAITAWTRGRLTFDDQPLRYVIETLNRYSSRPIVVTRSAGALRFSGIVFDHEIADWLQSLEVIFPVTVDERGAEVRIRMRRSTPAAHGLPKRPQADPPH
jgi:transmembrane sensor